MKKENYKTLTWLYSVPGKEKAYILILTVIQMLLGATGVLDALFLKRIVDYAVNRNTAGFWRAVVGLILICGFQISLQAVSRWLGEKARATLENLFKSRLTEKILQKDYAHVSAVHSGEWMTRLTNDTSVVANHYVGILPGFAGNAVRLLAIIIVLFVLQPRFTLIILPAAVVLFILIAILRPRLKRLHKDIQERDGSIRSFIQERINSLIVIKSFAAEDKTLDGAEGLMNDHKKARMRRIHYSNVLNTGFSAAMEGAFVFGACYCGYGILTGVVTYGTLAAVIQLIGQVRAPFARLSGYLPSYYAMLASAERLMEIEEFADDDSVKEIRSKEEIKVLYGEDFSAIGLKKACFAYYQADTAHQRADKELLPAAVENLSIEIRKGEYVAFTGHSGCGKSTVLKLLMCLYPLDSGERYIVDRNGIKTTLTSAYRRLFAYVPQGNLLITGSIREIVAFSEEKHEADEEKIKTALRIACASGFVQALDQGIDSRLGEHGTGLSEGQMQRIAIARAIYSEAPILLLDEATSALDAATEAKLLRNLRELTDKTVVIVTHRPAALQICDRILEFTENGVVER